MKFFIKQRKTVKEIFESLTGAYEFNCEELGTDYRWIRI